MHTTRKYLKTIEDPVTRLNLIHQNLTFRHGEMIEELPEQFMTVRFLEETATVLELGSNIGRNTCIVATILDDDRRLVTLETIKESFDKLKENRDLNGFRFHIENAALSKIPLCQSGWITQPYKGELPENHVMINTITFDEIRKKYNLVFDTLVADCEGALSQILKDDPTILENIKTVIVENDYLDINDKHFVDSVFDKYGLKPVFSMPGGLLIHPCRDFFYQVFKKIKTT